MPASIILLSNTTALDIAIYATSGFSVLMTTLVTILFIAGHLRHFVRITAQTHIIRILLMAPIYAVDSWLSILFVEYSVYFDLIRDCYEAFVLHQFFNLLVYYFTTRAHAYFEAYGDFELMSGDDYCEGGGGTISTPIIKLGGGGEFSDSISIGSCSSEEEEENESSIQAATVKVEESLIVVDPVRDIQDDMDFVTSHYLSKFGFVHYTIPCCCLPPSFTDGMFYLRIRRFIFQYVLLKPILAIIAIILHVLDLYRPGSFDWRYGYLWITIIGNISVAIALYALLLFYRLIKPVILGNYPLGKLLSIKAVLFFVFWQSVLIAMISGFIPNIIIEWTHWDVATICAITNNILICFEMMILSFVNIYVFPYTAYKEEEGQEVSASDVPMSRIKKYKQITKVLSAKDIVQDSKEIILGKESSITKKLS